MKILKSLSDDPMRNLALERELLIGRTEDFLLLYINRPSVIVGRNQSPAAETDLELCRRLEIPVIQRISGGGTVYHDHGNINYSFITARGEPPLLDSRPHQPIVDALAAMGVATTVGPRGELLTGGRKISGTASYVTGRRQLFHGTLLYDTDLVTMRLVLRGNTAERGRKIASVPSETTNLKPLLPRFGTPRAFMESLAAQIAINCNAGEPEAVIFKNLTDI